jgi:hypothetical protein
LPFSEFVMLLRARDHDSETGQRNRFIRRICETGRAFAVAGPDGLSRVPSKRWKGREVTLLWSEQMLAQSWAARQKERVRIKELSIADIVQDVFPALVRFKRLTGTDWGVDPIEAEAEPRELSERLRIEAVNAFVARVARRGMIWIFESEDGPGLLISGTRTDHQMLPCWSSGEEADRRRIGPFEEMTATAIPLHSFLGRTLPWLEESRRLVAPEYFWGGGTIELEPEELRMRLLPHLATA